MKKFIGVLIGIAFLAAAGWYGRNYCTTYFEAERTAQHNTEALAKLKVGTLRNEVFQQLGQPGWVEAYPFGNRVIEFLFYRSKGLGLWLKDAPQQWQPVGIETDSGRVFGTDRAFYEQVKASARR